MDCLTDWLIDWLIDWFHQGCICTGKCATNNCPCKKGSSSCCEECGCKTIKCVNRRPVISSTCYSTISNFKKKSVNHLRSAFCSVISTSLLSFLPSFLFPSFPPILYTYLHLAPDQHLYASLLTIPYLTSIHFLLETSSSRTITGYDISERPWKRWAKLKWAKFFSLTFSYCYKLA